MSRAGAKRTKTFGQVGLPGYDVLLTDIARVIEAARRTTARAVNAIMTSTYWLVGRRIVEQEQHGAARADYGKEIIERLSIDLQTRFGRGFGRRNLFQMRTFYLAYPEILQTLPANVVSASDSKKVQTLSAQLVQSKNALEQTLTLPWSHYVRLLVPDGRSRFERRSGADAGPATGSSSQPHSTD
jgi:DUF1016 N-terminal domain